MKKFIAAMSLLALMNFGTCSAETVHAVGRGNTERNAIHDAMRNAIEQKLGATVQSKTRVQNSMVVADKIAVTGAGLISRWEVVSCRVVNGIYVAEIVAALKRQGFTRTVDIAQVNRAVRQRINSAAGDAALCKTLADDFHADCLVVAEVSFTAQGDICISSRLIELNTGEIIFAGTSTCGGDFMSDDDALKLAGRRAAGELSFAALKDAAQVGRHLTLLITPATFERLGGTLTAVRGQIRELSGVNDAFARKMTSSLELDVDFDGTAADFAQVLEAFAIRILELGASYVKI